MTSDSPSKTRNPKESKHAPSSLIINSRKPLGIVLPILLMLLAIYGLGQTVYTLIAAAILAYLTQPLSNYLTQRGLSDLVVQVSFTLLVSACILTILLVEIPQAISQLIGLLQALPDNSQQALAHVREQLLQYNIDPEILSTGISQNVNRIMQNLQHSLYATSSQLLSLTIHQVSNLFNLLINIILFPLLYFSLLRHHTIGQRMMLWVPKEALPFWLTILRAGNRVLSGYLRGQGVIIVVLGSTYTICLNILGIPFATAIGVMTGVMTIIPYVGFTVGLFLSLIMGMTIDPSIGMIIKVIVVFSLIALIEGTFLIPHLIGHHLGVHPVLALTVIIVGGNLFGIVGYVLAVPICSLAMQLLGILHQHYGKTWNLTRRPRQASTS